MSSFLFEMKSLTISVLCSDECGSDKDRIITKVFWVTYVNDYNCRTLDWPTILDGMMFVRIHHIER